MLLVNLSKGFGGAEVRLLQTARALEARDWYYKVAVLEDSPLLHALAAERLAVVPVGSHRADPRIARGLVRAAKDIGAMCIDAHNTQSQYWAAIAVSFLPSVRLIFTVHSVYRECYPRIPKLQIHEGALRFGRWRRANFVAVSDTVAGDLARLGIAQQHLAVSENGIESLSSKPKPSALFENLGWGADTFVISVVGRLEPVKGHAYLLKALAGLQNDELSRLRVLFVGVGRAQLALETQVAEFGLADNVHFAGFRQDIPALLARTDLLCMPSLTEGMPYTVLEAGRQGVPMLLSKVGGPATVFTEGESAIFVPPANPEALRTAISEMLRAPERLAKLGMTAQRLVASRFSIERMIQETLAVYDG